MKALSLLNHTLQRAIAWSSRIDGMVSGLMAGGLLWIGGSGLLYVLVPGDSLPVYEGGWGIVYDAAASSRSGSIADVGAG